jgi:hypothetical protein
VAIVSLGVALAASAIAWRLSRDQRARSDARVAALAAAADDAERQAGRTPLRSVNAPSSGDQEPAASWTFPSRVTPVAGGSRGFARGQELALRTDPSAEVLGDRPDRQVSPAAEWRDSFLGAAPTVVPANGRQRWLAAAAGVLLVVLAGAVSWVVMDTGAASTRGAEATAAPLELVSLRHERRGSTLAVSGLVRNPILGHPVEHLSAVVFLFDQGGTFVTSGQTTVDFLKLGPGDESPFVIQVDAPASVTRYRVSFRTSEGMVPHVDRREQPPVSHASVELDRNATRQ